MTTAVQFSSATVNTPLGSGRGWEMSGTVISGRGQCRIKVDAIDPAAIRPVQEIGPRPRTRTGEKSSLLWL